MPYDPPNQAAWQESPGDERLPVVQGGRRASRRTPATGSASTASSTTTSRPTNAIETPTARRRLDAPHGDACRSRRDRSRTSSTAPAARSRRGETWWPNRTTDGAALATGSTLLARARRFRAWSPRTCRTPRSCRSCSPFVNQRFRSVGRPVRPRLGAHRAGRHPLEPVVPDRGGRAEGRVDVARRRACSAPSVECAQMPA